MGKEKIQSFAKTNVDWLPTETAFGKIYRTENKSVEKTAVINTNVTTYKKGVTDALNKFLNYHTTNFARKF